MYIATFFFPPEESGEGRICDHLSLWPRNEQPAHWKEKADTWTGGKDRKNLLTADSNFTPDTTCKKALVSFIYYV